jgi:hypothetical protein
MIGTMIITKIGMVIAGYMVINGGSLYLAFSFQIRCIYAIW